MVLLEYQFENWNSSLRTTYPSQLRRHKYEGEPVSLPVLSKEKISTRGLVNNNKEAFGRYYNQMNHHAMMREKPS